MELVLIIVTVLSLPSHLEWNDDAANPSLVALYIKVVGLVVPPIPTRLELSIGVRINEPKTPKYKYVVNIYSFLLD